MQGPTRAIALFAWMGCLSWGIAMAEPPKGDTLTLQPAADGDEAVVDDGDQLYKDRPYGGIIPSIRDRMDEGPKSAGEKGEAPTVTWIGFVHRPEVSSVFIQLDRPTTFPYRVYKPDDLQIRVDIPGASLPIRNDQRELETAQFPGQVARVWGRLVSTRDFKGVRVAIDLKKSAAYNYYERDAYLFIDIER